MNDRNKQGEPICEFSDLPVVMCAHCSGKTSNPEPIGLHALPSKPGRPVDLAGYRSLPYYPPAPPQVLDIKGGRACDCGAPCGDAFICPACADDVIRFLANVPFFVENLEIAAQRRDRVTVGRRPAKAPADSPRLLDGWDGFAEGSVDPDMPVTAAMVAADASQRWARILGHGRPDKAAAGEALDALHAELVFAVRILLERIGQTYVGDPTSQGISLWLLTHSRSIALSPAGPDIADAMRRIHRRAMAIIDNAAELVRYGRCGTEGCDAELLVPAGVEVWQCPGCGTAYSVAGLDQWRQDLAADQCGTTGELVAWAATFGAKVTARRLRYWIESGRLLDRGETIHEGKRAKLYRLGDVLDLAATKRVG